MITQSTWVRDTLIRIEVLNQLPADRRQQIEALFVEFNAIGYIDARTEIGPDQYARMSEKRRAQIGANACKVFAIESSIKLLLRTDEQIAADEKILQEKALSNKISYVTRRIKQLEQFCSRKLNSKRDNGTKREYGELKTELNKLQMPA